MWRLRGRSYNHLETTPLLRIRLWGVDPSAYSPHQLQGLFATCDDDGGVVVKELVDYVDGCSTNEILVDIGAVAFTTNLNVLSKLIFSLDFGQYDTMSLQEFREIVMTLLELMAKPNLADFFPILRWLDPQGSLRQGNIYGMKLLTIIDRIIDERLQSRSRLSTNNDVLDSLLNLVEEDKSLFSRDDMRHLFYDLLLAGIDTTSSTLEWAMAELIHNPEKMETARSEIIKLMQNNNGNIQEMHISQLPYLQAFEWKLEGKIRAQDMDMEETVGLKLPRKIPLMAIPIKL
ncbi:hypothetical protein L1887_38856 [Cichorium endivia]|nr:hypothetical protein L1887_38856 [Cichorium endivia]